MFFKSLLTGVLLFALVHVSLSQSLVSDLDTLSGVIREKDFLRFLGEPNTNYNVEKYFAKVRIKYRGKRYYNRPTDYYLKRRHKYRNSVFVYYNGGDTLKVTLSGDKNRIESYDVVLTSERSFKIDSGCDLEIISYQSICSYYGLKEEEFVYDCYRLWIQGFVVFFNKDKTFRGYSKTYKTKLFKSYKHVFTEKNRPFFF